MAAPFATADELREWIGGDVIDVTRADRLVTGASAIIRRFTGQVLSVVLADVVTFPETEGDTLFLPERPVTAVTEVLLGGAGGQVITDFTFSSNGVLKRELGWSEGAQVTYDHGFAATSDQFEALRTLTVQVAARAFTFNKGSEFEQFGGAVSEASGFAPEAILYAPERQLLADFGKVLIG